MHNQNVSRDAVQHVAIHWRKVICKPQGDGCTKPGTVPVKHVPLTLWCISPIRGDPTAQG